MTPSGESLVYPVTAVVVDGRALMLEGPPGSGKSSLALALIERGARLIGDDAVSLTRDERVTPARLLASPPPNIEGLIEVRGVGLLSLEVAEAARVALILELREASQRLPENAPLRPVLDCLIPSLPFEPGPTAPAERALAALTLHGLPV
ncbi:MAG: serine kinase [Pseudomonadota bacterium]